MQFGEAFRSVGVGRRDWRQSNAYATQQQRVGGSEILSFLERRAQAISTPEADREKKDNCPSHWAEWTNNELHYRIVPTLNHFLSPYEDRSTPQTTNAAIANSS